VAIWLKLVGAVDAPMPDPWLVGRTDLQDEVGFTRRAAVDIGEELVMYAIPQGRVIGIAEVVSHPIKGRQDGEERWPWRSKIRWRIAIADYARCPTLADVSTPGGRKLSGSVGRQSHISLTWAEFERARDLLETAFDAAKGDRRA
jgi:hypothetical protein